jgi:hypothetical protein
MASTNKEGAVQLAYLLSGSINLEGIIQRLMEEIMGSSNSCQDKKKSERSVDWFHVLLSWPIDI